MDWRQENIRLDWTVTNSTRLMVRWTHDSWKADRNQWGDDPFPVVRSLWNQPGKSLVAQLNQNIGSSMVNSLTFSYSANTITVTRAGDEELVYAADRGDPDPLPGRHQAAGGRGPAGRAVGVARPLLGRHPLEPGALAEQPGPVRAQGRLVGRLRRALREGRIPAQLQQEERGARATPRRSRCR